ncbi:hypothetical protein [Halobacterium jilantaiense]|uniref:Transglutaminase-like superfamily protein n=1 Tax=Halobacterium jilantaiense TaxID=355548 RepID=A0A1I0P865_9EURY|nr:hypothetical protein [Halobacterium jilantaiense]SEW10321.1 hypothetical protein SAMN04487945_1465 [Halobacterium jilantaiense]
MKKIQRRQMLLASAGILAGTAGCASDDSNSDDSIKDSDGDGVIDSEDYAPRDPDVQSREDLDSTPTATAEPTETTTRPTTTAPTTTTTTEEPPSQSSSEMLNATVPSARTGVTHYNGRELVVKVRDYPEIEQDPARLAVITSGFPDGETYASGRSETFTPPSNGDDPREITVSVEGDLPEDERIFHSIVAIPDKEISEVSAEEVTRLGESAAFKLNGTSIERDEPDYLPDEDETDSFSRVEHEGSFNLDYSGSTNGREWSAGIYFYKSAYATMRSEPRGRDYDEYVAVANSNGNAEALAGILDSTAEDNGFESKREKVEFVIDFVQSLPYVTDDVSRGYDEYPKFPTETLVDSDGDCEDTAILLASILQADPFNYDMILIGPPEHMAAGIYSEEINGNYYELDGRDYYYIETTGTGWGIGDIPETYDGERATLYQV